MNFNHLVSLFIKAIVSLHKRARHPENALESTNITQLYFSEEEKYNLKSLFKIFQRNSLYLFVLNNLQLIKAKKSCNVIFFENEN